MSKQYDFGIIGAGPAGYSAAIRASQLNKSVVLFEKEFLGGVCLNKGCIPTKTFLHCADVYNSLKKVANLGINIENYSLDFEKVAERKEKTVEKLRKSLEMLLKSYEIEIINAEAKIEGQNIIEANGEEFECANILIATGSEPKCVGGFQFDHEFILSSDDILNLKSLPKKVLIAGSGAIGIEWARIFSTFGVEVSIVEIADKLLPLADSEISERLARTFKMSRIKMFLSTSIKEISDNKVTLSSGEILEPDFVLFATGRKSIEVGVETPTYSKIGDCSGGIQLAHFASHQGVQVVENIVLGKEIKDFLVPAVVYGSPEIAWVGKTEAELSGTDYKKIVFPMSALGKAHADGDLEGFIKILADNEGKFLGTHIIGAEASALIHQISIAMQNNLKVEDLKHCCFAHPTYSEGVYEALLGLDNESLSMLKG
jgi:dihydrolipoamide dehydrogenase